jgi:hypothetical protein
VLCVRVESQTAITLAHRELAFAANIDDVVHFFGPNDCIYNNCANE